jgi:hypothetical protein
MEEGRLTRLLSTIWGQRSGYVFLPYKVQPDRWYEVPGVPYDGKGVPSVREQSRADHYFCPVVFKEPIRQKQYALPTNVLWSDLDTADPGTCRLRPSVAWESSPGRYQALWFLSTDIDPDQAALLSKRIAYADGADKGGWDLTQVLRIPGTHNHKYPSSPEVKLLWAKRSSYSVDEIKAAYPPVNGQAAAGGEALGSWPEADEPQIQIALTALPVGLRKRITQDTTGADRSKELQMLARDLTKHGMAREILVHVLQRSTWNKFRGRGDEQLQILKQVNDAAVVIATRRVEKQQAEVVLEDANQMKVSQWGSFMSIPTRLRWLVDDSWVDQSVGFISGRSKSYKTWIALDLALSVVSGEAFLGRYPVRRTGPVLLVQEEDPTPVLQERLRLIGKSKGMLPTAEWDEGKQILHLEYPEYPLHVINLQGFRLTEDKVKQVRHLIATINPVMVILDPLVVMLPPGVDEYKGSEISAVLQSVKMWREEFGCAVAIVHHWNKGKNEAGERFAEHMYGSFAFHAWLESALHVMPIIPEEEAQDQHIDSVVVEREFKAAQSGRSLRLKFAIDSVKDYSYSVKFEDDKVLAPTEQQIVDLIGSAGAMTVPELVAATGHTRPKISEACNRLLRIQVLRGKKGGGRGKSSIFWLPDQPEPE